MGGRNVAIAHAAEKAGFDTTNWSALSHLLTAVKGANGSFEQHRPRAEMPKTDSCRPGHAQAGKVKLLRTSENPSLDNQAAEPKSRGDYYRPKRRADENDNEHSHNNSGPSSKRRRTKKLQPELSKLTLPDRTVLAPRDKNATQTPMLLALGSHAVTLPNKENVKAIAGPTTGTQNPDKRTNYKLLQSVRRKVELAEKSLQEDKKILSQRWEADKRFQQVEMVDSLEELAENMHRAEVSLGRARTAARMVIQKLG